MVTILQLLLQVTTKLQKNMIRIQDNGLLNPSPRTLK